VLFVGDLSAADNPYAYRLTSTCHVGAKSLGRIHSRR
jgi:hypothetical protein